MLLQELRARSSVDLVASVGKTIQTPLTIDSGSIDMPKHHQDSCKLAPVANNGQESNEMGPNSLRPSKESDDAFQEGPDKSITCEKALASSSNNHPDVVSQYATSAKKENTAQPEEVRITNNFLDVESDCFLPPKLSVKICARLHNGVKLFLHLVWVNRNFIL